MKHGFYLSGTVHGVLISFLFTNGVFFMPDMQIENFEKLDILILSDAEFDAMISLPPTVENFSNSFYEKPKTFSQDSKLKGSIAEIPNSVTKHDISKLNLLNPSKEIVKPFTPPTDLIPNSSSILESKSSDKEKVDFEFNKLGNEINSLNTPTLENPKSREADRVDIIASDNKTTQKISDNLTEIVEENTQELELKIKNNSKEANKEATTKISPDAQKNVDIVKGVVEKSVMPLTRSITEITNNAKLEENISGNLQNTINKLVETVNEVSDNGDYDNKTLNSTISTIEKLKLRKSINQLIGKYWNKGILIGGSDFENYVVKVEILLDNEGNIQGNIRPISPSIPYGRYAIAFREASNAIKAVGKIPIPSEKYKKGLKLKLTFDPALGIGFD